MQKPKEIGEIALYLWYLPLEKVAEIKQQVLALKEQCGYAEPTDDSDEWTREDEIEFSQATMRRMEENDPWPEGDTYGEEKPDAKAG